MPKKLTAKQARFAEEYIIDLNATQAAIRVGYSEKTAYSQGQRLLKKVEVKTAIDAALAKRSERTKITADWVLQRLVDEVEADLADLFDENGKTKPVHEWPEVFRTGLVAGIEVSELLEGAGKVSKFKLSDRLKRIELIGKHVDINAFRDQHGVGNPDGTPLDTVDDNEIARRLAFILRKGSKQ